jgi:adenylate cyclase
MSTESRAIATAPPDIQASAADPSHAIAAAFEQVLQQESLRNERTLAYTRSLVLLISTSLDILVFWFPETLIGQPSVPPTIALVGVFANGIALAILVQLRQPQRWPKLQRLQTAIPLFDGLLLALFITNIARVLGQSHPQILTNIAAFCSLLAVSGGMRLQKRASLLTSALAVINFLYAAALFQLDLGIALFAAITILGTGLLGVWMAAIVRRQVKSEVGRQVIARFLPKQVVEAAFEAPLQLLQPQTYSVTILVSDLRGFTQYAEKLEPVAVLAFLNQIQELQAQLVSLHGGWVDKFMGDGMLAVFGAPEPLANSAEQALKTAKAICHVIGRCSPLPIGIGLHSGSVVAGCLGSGSRMEFTVIGDTVNVAARIEALTRETDCSVLLSDAVRQQLGLESQIALRSLGPMPIRGRQEGLEVFGLSEQS